MSKGGSTSTSPWSGVQPYLLQNYDFASQVLANPPSYYPGQTFVGPMPQELGAWQSQANFLGNVFGMPMQLNSQLPQAPTYGSGYYGGYQSPPGGMAPPDNGTVTVNNPLYPVTQPISSTAPGGTTTFAPGDNIETPSSIFPQQPSAGQTAIQPIDWDAYGGQNTIQPISDTPPTQSIKPDPTGTQSQDFGAGTTGGSGKGGAQPATTIGSTTPTTTASAGKGGATSQPTTTPTSPGTTPEYSQFVDSNASLLQGGPNAGLTNALGGLTGSNLAQQFQGPTSMIGPAMNLYGGLSSPSFNWQQPNLQQGLSAPNFNWQPQNLMQGVNPVGLDWQQPDLTQGINTPQINYGGYQAPDLTSQLGGAPQINYQGYQAPDLTSGVQNPQLNWQAPNLQQGINRIGMDVGAFTPQLSQDVQQSISSMMQPGGEDYSGLQAAVDAATRPMMRNFEQQILPALSDRNNLLNNSTGAVKDLNRIIPELERNVGDIGAQLAWQERMRAGQERQFGTQLGASTALQQYGLGLQGAGQQAGLDAQTQQLLANMGLSGAQLGLQGASTQAGLDQATQQLLAQQGATQAGLGLQGWQTGANLAAQQAGLQGDFQRLLGSQLGLEGQLGLQGWQTGAGLAERQAGLDAQTQALLAGQNLAGSQLGLQGATTQAGLLQNYMNTLAGQNALSNQLGLQAAQTGAGLGMDWNQLLGGLNTTGANLGLNAAQFGSNLGMDWNRLLAGQNVAQGGLNLQTDQAQQNVLDQYRNSVLGLGSLYGDMQGQVSQNMQAGQQMWPSVMAQGMLPGQFQMDYASQFLRPFAEQGLASDMNRYNYYQGLPMQMGDWYSGILSGAGGLGGTQQYNPGAGETMSQAAGTAASMYLLYLMASDRSLKTDIRPATGVLDGLKRLPIYNWRYRGDPTPHVGPMAQDFQEIFGVGDGKHLNLVDVVGVLLGAMKELAEARS